MAGTGLHNECAKHRRLGSGFLRVGTARSRKNVGRSQPGTNGLTFLPYFFRKRLPNLPDSCAVIHGSHSTNLNRHDIARALIEGIVIGLAHGIQRLVDFGISADEFESAVVGPISATMRQIVSDIFGLPVIGFTIAEGAALDAAVQAAWGYCQIEGQPLPLEKIVNSADKTDSKTPAEPRKENETFCAELREQYADFARKLACSGYL